jgi:NAD(P)H-dependent FMN reductase
MLEIGKKLAQADAYIIIVPEYNHSFPAALKFIIDSFYSPWRVKPIAFVSYGGMSGGIRAVEQLRQVFAEMHAVCIRAGVILPNAWNLFGAKGELLQPDVVEKSMTTVLLQLEWWATALKNARENSTTNYLEVIK